MPRSYLSKEVAASRSGRSVRRLRELAATGRIRKKTIREPENGNREATLFDAADIAALARGETPRVELAVRPLAALPQPAASVVHRWLTVAEAAEYSGLPPNFLIKLICTGKLPAFDVGPRPGGRWRVAARDLNSLQPTKVSE